MNLRNYRLSPDTYACLADGYLIFCNICTDKYYCLSPENTQIFASYLAALPDRDVSGQRREDIPQASRIAEVLTRNNLIVKSELRDPCRYRPYAIPPALHSLRRHTEAPETRPMSRSIAVRFLKASACASFKLRFWPLVQTLRAIESRRRLNSGRVDEEVVRITVAAFNRLRPYYPRSYVCRFDSLALIELLARYGQYPLWVFGVKARPFGAHCWVQEGETVLNDNVNYIERFTPIMAF